MLAVGEIILCMNKWQKLSVVQFVHWNDKSINNELTSVHITYFTTAINACHYVSCDWSTSRIYNFFIVQLYFTLK